MTDGLCSLTQSLQRRNWVEEVEFRPKYCFPWAGILTPLLCIISVSFLLTNGQLEYIFLCPKKVLNFDFCISKRTYVPFHLTWYQFFTHVFHL